MPLSDYERPLNNPRLWRGLSTTDSRILAAAIDAQLLPPGRAHFYVPVGHRAGLPQLEAPPQDTGSPADATYRRIDLVLVGDGPPLIVEIKPSAAYVALGQVLSYTHLAARQWPELARALPAILTDGHDPALSPLAAEQGIRIIETDPGRYVPLPRPT